MFALTQLFWYKILFSVELMAAESLFTFKLRKKRLFPLRLAAGVIVMIALSVFFPLPENNSPQYSLLVFFVQFAVSIALMAFIFKEPLLSLLFCGVAAYAVQHLAYQCFTLVMYASGANGGAAMGLYGEVEAAPFDWHAMPIYMTVYVFVYWAMTLIFASKIKRNEDLSIKSYSMFALFVMAVFAVVIINIFVAYEAYSDYNLTYIVFAALSGALCCLFVLFLLFTLLRSENLKTENEYINRLWRQEQRQLATAKANADFIKRACHDLKYSLRIKTGDGSARDELKKAVALYDTYAETGNAALDVIITERASECAANDIKLDCMADGAALSFMNEVDLYTLFGNAFDNAIEAVKKTEPSRRVISLSVTRAGQMLSVSMRNYYSGDVHMNGGLPETTKADREFHGYGLQSIKRITEKYGGNVQITARDGIFNLGLLFFMPKSTDSVG